MKQFFYPATFLLCFVFAFFLFKKKDIEDTKASSSAQVKNEVQSDQGSPIVPGKTQRRLKRKVSESKPGVGSPLGSGQFQMRSMKPVRKSERLAPSERANRRLTDDKIYQYPDPNVPDESSPFANAQNPPPSNMLPENYQLPDDIPTPEEMQVMEGGMDPGFPQPILENAIEPDDEESVEIRDDGYDSQGYEDEIQE